MNKHLHHFAFGVGLAAVGWIAAGYLGTNTLALAMTSVIAVFYLMGALELHRFRQATTALDLALAAPPPAADGLPQWLARVPAGLRDAVRSRLEGDRLGLPGPAMTPYLAGLLVLLGMLGTFLGMVVTLRGTGLALESARDLASMRESLAAPVKGLGLAFGTSVAGVAASAMLGLMSALSRRDRLRSAQQLDALIGGPLREWTPAHRGETSLRLQQEQATLMQEHSALMRQQARLAQEQAALTQSLAQQLQAAMSQVQDEAVQSRLALQGQATHVAEHLLAGQADFHDRAQAAYRELAQSVEQSLRLSLDDGARAAAAALEPAVQSAMDGIARETAALHERVAAVVQRQLDGLAQQAGSTLEAQLHGIDLRLSQALARQERATEAALDGAQARLESQAAAWMETLAQAQQAQLQALSSGEAQRLAAWTQALAGTTASLQQQWQQAGEQTLAQQAQICRTLEDTAGRITAQAEAHARATVDEVARLVQAASEAPRAAADLVAQLREKLADSLARDQSTLEERARVMATLHTLLEAVQHTSTEQKVAIDRLVASSAEWMAQAQARFGQQMDGESARLEQASAQVAAGAAEVASLGEAFMGAVQLFGQNGERLAGQLQRLEETLSRSIERSDDQLAYYVAQAREVIDLSLMSQRQIVEELQRVATVPAAAAAAQEA